MSLYWYRVTNQWMQRRLAPSRQQRKRSRTTTATILVLRRRRQLRTRKQSTIMDSAVAEAEGSATQLREIPSSRKESVEGKDEPPSPQTTTSANDVTKRADGTSCAEAMGEKTGTVATEKTVSSDNGNSPHGAVSMATLEEMNLQPARRRGDPRSWTMQLRMTRSWWRDRRRIARGSFVSEGGRRGRGRAAIPANGNFRQRASGSGAAGCGEDRRRRDGESSLERRRPERGWISGRPAAEAIFHRGRRRGGRWIVDARVRGSFVSEQRLRAPAERCRIGRPARQDSKGPSPSRSGGERPGRRGGDATERRGGREVQQGAGLALKFMKRRMEFSTIPTRR